MANSDPDKLKQTPDKKLNRILIEQKLEESFAELRNVVGKKKFNRCIKKAGKLINNGFAKKAIDRFRKSNESGENSINNIDDESEMAINDLV